MPTVSDLTPRSPRVFAHVAALRATATVVGRIAEAPRYHGVGAAARLLGRALGTSAATMTISRSDGTFRIGLGDSYWARLLIDDFRYEPEIAALLEHLPRPFSFVDCGANIGYWSVRAARIVGAENVVAVEASSHLADTLEAQAHLNGDFRCIHAAVWRENGTLRFAGSREMHASGKIADEGVAVAAVTLDEVTAGMHAPFVVKLDIEGAELDALAGASRLLDTEPTVIFEELGSEHGHPVVRFFLDRGARVAMLTEDGPVPVTDPGEFARLKVERERGRDPRLVGHNLVAH